MSTGKAEDFLPKPRPESYTVEGDDSGKTIQIPPPKPAKALWRIQTDEEACQAAWARGDTATARYFQRRVRAKTAKAKAYKKAAAKEAAVKEKERVKAEKAAAKEAAAKVREAA